MRTQWTITTDHIADPKANEGTNDNARTIVGPRGATLSHAEIVAHPQGQKFRLYDDDGELYYEGVVVGDDIMRPLDDFGTPNAGCTNMTSYSNGVWTKI